MNDAPDAPPSSLIYARQSLGNTASIAEQLDLGHARASTEGWAVHAVYSDPISASRYAHKAREDWPKLVADVQHDRADVIWLWESSRGDRRASAWLTLLEDCRDHGVRIYVESHHRLYDMDIPRDWRTLAEDGTDSEYESAKTSLRLIRSAAERAAAGQVNGRAPFGYHRRYELNPAGKRVSLGQEPHPDEAPIVEEIIARVAAGESLRSIAASLNERGVPTPRGAQWSTTQVRLIALNLAYIGKRVHAPGSRKCRSVPGPGAAVYDAAWPALVDEPVFYAARRILLDPARTTTRPGKAKHLLSLLATCAVCGGKLTVTYRLREGRQPSYACRDRNCIRIDQGDLDSYVTAEVLAVLARPGRGSGSSPREPRGTPSWIPPAPCSPLSRPTTTRPCGCSRPARSARPRSPRWSPSSSPTSKPRGSGCPSWRPRPRCASCSTAPPTSPPDGTMPRCPRGARRSRRSCESASASPPQPGTAYRPRGGSRSAGCRAGRPP